MSHEKLKAAVSIAGNLVFAIAVIAAIVIAGLAYIRLAVNSPGVAIVIALVVIAVVLIRRLPKRS